jgi:hypothetical protein
MEGSSHDYAVFNGALNRNKIATQSPDSRVESRSVIPNHDFKNDCSDARLQ